MPKTFDPFSAIPSSDAIRERLSRERDFVRKLEILLRTAEEIEQQQPEVHDTSANGGGTMSDQRPHQTERPDILRTDLRRSR